ncbi:MAG TPA: DUF6438 domain-containing protein [Polyangiaceae bacterium]
MKRVGAAAFLALALAACSSSKTKPPPTPAAEANVVDVGDAAVIVGDAGPKIASGASVPADAGLGAASTFDAGDTSNAPFSLRFERTACFGTCPQYVVKVDNEGHVDFSSSLANGPGRGHWIDGCATKEIGQKGVVALQDAVHEATFFDLKAEYSGGPTDAPWAYTTVNAENKIHTVKHYSAAPMKADEKAKLQKLEAAIDQITGASDFVKQAGKLKACKYDPSK